jgi:hypothetical protein
MALRAVTAPQPADSVNSRWGSPKSIPALGGRLRTLGAAFRSSAAVAASHVQEHGYFLCAATSADAAGFVHSTFAGLMVMAGTFLAIEWRVSKGA